MSFDPNFWHHFNSLGRCFTGPFGRPAAGSQWVTRVFFFEKGRRKKVKNKKLIFFIDVKLDFIRLAHHFVMFFFLRYLDRFFLNFFDFTIAEPTSSLDNGKIDVFEKKVEKFKKIKTSFIDVKLDFMRFMHHFNVFSFDFRPCFLYFSISPLLLRTKKKKKTAQNRLKPAKTMVELFLDAFLCDLAQFFFFFFYRSCRIDVTKT